MLRQRAIPQSHKFLRSSERINPGSSQAQPASATCRPPAPTCAVFGHQPGAGYSSRSCARRPGCGTRPPCTPSCASVHKAPTIWYWAGQIPSLLATASAGWSSSFRPNAIQGVFSAIWRSKLLYTPTRPYLPGSLRLAATHGAPSGMGDGVHETTGAAAAAGAGTAACAAAIGGTSILAGSI